jgi:hypothetical protein
MNYFTDERKEELPTTAVLRNGEFSASYESLVVGSRSVLRMNICAKIRHYAKPRTVWRSVYKDSQPYIQAHLVLPKHKAETETKRA